MAWLVCASRLQGPPPLVPARPGNRRKTPQPVLHLRRCLQPRAHHCVAPAPAPRPPACSRSQGPAPYRPPPPLLYGARQEATPAPRFDHSHASMLAALRHRRPTWLALALALAALGGAAGQVLMPCSLTSPA